MNTPNQNQQNQGWAKSTVPPDNATFGNLLDNEQRSHRQTIAKEVELEKSVKDLKSTIETLSENYRSDYKRELESCDRWIKWCEVNGDTHGTNFHQGMRSALIFHNIKFGSLIDTLKEKVK